MELQGGKAVTLQLLCSCRAHRVEASNDGRLGVLVTEGWAFLVTEGWEFLVTEGWGLLVTEGWGFLVTEG